MLISRVVGRRDREEAAVEVGVGKGTPLPVDRALLDEPVDLRVGRLRSDHGHLGVAGEQALDLLERDVAGPDDQAAAPVEAQAGDVERRLEHPPHAGLVADPLAELADAFLAGKGLSGHARKRNVGAVSAIGRAVACTGSFQLAIDADRAIALFTPEGERAWVEGWDPRYPVEGADDSAPGTVFVTAAPRP